MAGSTWSKEETMMAFALYWLLPQSEYKANNQDVLNLGRAIGRDGNSVKMKLENLKRGDPNRQALGQKGLSHGSKLELIVWDEYFADQDGYLAACIKLLGTAVAGYKCSSSVEYATVDLPPVGSIRMVQRAERVNQEYFRNNLLHNYKGKCCLTGLSEPKLLVASHIKPWAVSDPKTERLAASNGLLLNALHDRAFDQGLMTIDKNYRVVLSSKLKRDDVSEKWLFKFEGQKITEPSVMPPAREFIEYHNDMVFVA
jgi:putative restriction endonuclease